MAAELGLNREGCLSGPQQWGERKEGEKWGRERGLRQTVRQTAPEGHPPVWHKAGDGEVVLVKVEARDAGKWGRPVSTWEEGLGNRLFPEC